MNRSVKLLKSEVLLNKLLWTKNNPENLVWRLKVYLYNDALKYVFTNLLYDNNVIICAVN